MFELIEAVRGRLIGPKTWDRIVWIYGTQITVRDCSRTVWVANGVIHSIEDGPLLKSEGILQI